MSLTSFLSSKEIFDAHLVVGFVFVQRLIGQRRSLLTVNENVFHRRGPTGSFVRSFYLDHSAAEQQQRFGRVKSSNSRC